ncbi:MAG: TonB-dependent receptor [Burkholderiales bacterium]|nr:TonB-dependent receptor [Burkholderiales bacterium]
MKSMSIAGIAGLAAFGAQAQTPFAIAFQQTADPVVVTASRGLTPMPTLRDTVVITRDDIEAAGPLSLGELLQRRAGLELRAVGGPGQPQTLFIRGAGTAQTLVLVDGMRVGSATVGTTSIEHIPLEMIERIEVVKGPLSSLYGPEAIGGVIQVFTRGRLGPHLFVNAGFGSEKDRRASAGIVTEDGALRLALAMGVREVDARSATNPRAFGYNPDRDPHRNAFANVKLSHKLWQGETVEIDAFTTRSRTHFDAGPGDDRNNHAISGAKLTSANEITPWWSARVSVAQGRDRLDISGSFPGFLETRQDQGAWVNELAIPAGKIIVGAETIRQKVRSDDGTPFSTTRRDTDSVFAGVNEAYAGHRFEASARRDKDDQFGSRNTGSTSYGFDFPPWGRLSATYARGFRAPTFFDLYGPSFPGVQSNPDLVPEQSRSTEYALQSAIASTMRWKLSTFDHRFENLIVFSALEGKPINVARARARGAEIEGEATWWSTRWRASFTAQRPRDEDTGKRLQGRAERFGSVNASRTFGAWTVSAGVIASGARYDSTNEAPATRLPGYALVDARVRYAFAKFWSAEVSAVNLADRQVESAVGYDAPRRGIFLKVTFQAS